MPAFEIIQAELLEWLSEYEGPRFHAILSDPPYALISIAKRFGKPGQAPAQEGADGRYSRLSGGFMGQRWDSFQSYEHYRKWITEWSKLLIEKALYPGAVCMFFGGTRTWHHLALGLEEGGFEIVDTLMWLYGCLDQESETLTSAGWKRGIDLDGDELVAQWNPETEQISLCPIKNLVIRPYRGPMISLINDNTNQLLTPNHRVYWRPEFRKQVSLSRKSWIAKSWMPKLVGAIKKHARFKVPLAGYHDGKGFGGVDYVSLLAWVWTEGGFDNSGTGVRIYQSSVNQIYVDEIDSLLAKLVPEHKRYVRKREYKSRPYEEIIWYFSGEKALRIRADLPDKHPTWDLLWSMSQPEKLAFFDAAMKGDGSLGNLQFWQKSPADREWFQALAHMIGMQGRDNPKKSSVACHNNPATEFQAKHNIGSQDYDGLVWCVEVETGAFVARRKGRVFITGNSGFPKSHDISKGIDKAAPRIGMFEEFASHYAAQRKEKGLTHNQICEEGKFYKEHNHGGASSNWELGLNVPTLAQWEILKPLLNLSDKFLPLIERIEAEREVLETRTESGKRRLPILPLEEADFDITISATDEARRWDGYGTALKPAHEFILAARAPQSICSLLWSIIWLLLHLEAKKCPSNWCAKIAEMDLASSLAEQSEALDFALWTAFQQPNTKEDLFGAMDTLQSELAINTSSNIELLLRKCLDGLLDQMKTYTTETESDTITALRILRCYLLEAMRHFIIRGETNQNGELYNADGVEKLLKNALASLEKRSTISVVEDTLGWLNRQGWSISDSEAARDFSKLRPDYLPIYLCRAPRQGKTFANLAIEFGSGALNIDGGRIAANPNDKDYSRPEGWRSEAEPGGGGITMGDGWKEGKTRRPFDPSGRWPANLVLSHHEDCIKIGEFEVDARVINRWKEGMKPFGGGAGGEYETVHPSREGEPSAERTYEDEGGTDFAMKPGARRDDTELVERWACVRECPARQLDDQAGERPAAKTPSLARGESLFRPDQGDYQKQGPIYGYTGGPSRFFYCGKAARREKDKGLENFYWKRVKDGFEQVTLAEYEKLDKRERAKGCIHPTLKPLAILRYLATLLLPPPLQDGKRRLLVPFAGSGSEIIAARQAGWDEVVGIEMEENYVEIARARLRANLGMF